VFVVASDLCPLVAPAIWYPAPTPAPEVLCLLRDCWSLYFGYSPCFGCPRSMSRGRSVPVSANAHPVDDLRSLRNGKARTEHATVTLPLLLLAYDELVIRGQLGASVFTAFQMKPMRSWWESLFDTSDALRYPGTVVLPPYTPLLVPLLDLPLDNEPSRGWKSPLLRFQSFHFDFYLRQKREIVCEAETFGPQRRAKASTCAAWLARWFPRCVQRVLPLQIGVSKVWAVLSQPCYFRTDRSLPRFYDCPHASDCCQTSPASASVCWGGTLCAHERAFLFTTSFLVTKRIK